MVNVVRRSQIIGLLTMDEWRLLKVVIMPLLALV